MRAEIALFATGCTLPGVESGPSPTDTSPPPRPDTGTFPAPDLLLSSCVPQSFTVPVLGVGERARVVVDLDAAVPIGGTLVFAAWFEGGGPWQGVVAIHPEPGVPAAPALLEVPVDGDALMHVTFGADVSAPVSWDVAIALGDQPTVDYYVGPPEGAVPEGCGVQ